jgi:4'-phosphopantetheinyl transferase
MPSPGQVEVWVADLAQVPDDLHRLLCASERERAAGLQGDGLRRRWSAARAVLRQLLAQDMGLDPAALRFEPGPNGKPQLLRSLDAKPRFNVSHSGTLALYALCADLEVGVDVELAGRRHDPSRDEVAIAKRVLGAQTAARLRGLPRPEREEEFLRAWVAHEALVKCLGTGLARAPRAQQAQPTAVWIKPLDVGAGAFAALAVQGGPVAVRQRVWRPSEHRS